MPKPVLIKASIHITDEINEDEYFAFRPFQGDIPDMAHLFAASLKDRPIQSFSGGKLFLRLGATRNGVLPDPATKPTKGKDVFTYHVVFQKGRKHPDLSVLDPHGTEVYRGSLYAFVVEYNELSVSRILVSVAEREKRTIRQRKRRKERRELIEYGNKHARMSPELRAKLKVVSLEEAERQIKLRKK